MSCENAYLAKRKTGSQGSGKSSYIYKIAN